MSIPQSNIVINVLITPKAPRRVQIPEDSEFTTMDEFINILTDQIDNWSAIFEETKPVELFVASEYNAKHGPVHLASTVWKNSLETILKNNFQSSSSSGRSPTWTIPLCIGMHDQSPDSEPEQPPPQLPRRKHKRDPKRRIKKEPEEQAVVKKEPSEKPTTAQMELETKSPDLLDQEISPALTRKRSFSDFNWEQYVAEQEEKWEREREAKERTITQLLKRLKEQEVQPRKSDEENCDLDNSVEDITAESTEGNANTEEGNQKEKVEEEKSEEEDSKGPAERTRYRNLRRV